MTKHSSALTLDQGRQPAATRAEAYAWLLTMLGIIGIGGAIALLPLGYRVAVTLGLIQGLAEFLPISSSAHLILTPWFLGWPDPGLTFDIALHVGTLVAVALYFGRDWLRLLGAASHPRTPDGRLFWLLLIGAIPGGIAGVLFETMVEQALRAPVLIAGTLALLGLVLYAADHWGKQHRDLHDIGLSDALWIGLAQAFAIIPGVSRAGITITLARARGIERESAARFSFLLGTPVIVGAALYQLRHLLNTPGALNGPFAAGVTTSAIVGVLSIGVMLRYLQRAGLGMFVVYRLLLSALVVATIVLGVR